MVYHSTRQAGANPFPLPFFFFSIWRLSQWSKVSKSEMGDCAARKKQEEEEEDEVEKKKKNQSNQT